MRMGSRTLVMALGVVSFFMQGCVSYSQPFMGPTGDLKVCASTSQDQGMTGVLLATNRFNTCVKALKAQGYKELETVGSIGILLHEEDASGFRIRKVYANSPAEKAGIIRGDIISAIDGHKVTQCSDMAMLQGAPGSPVTITVNRNGTTVSYNLIRALSFYDRMLGDITYRP